MKRLSLPFGLSALAILAFVSVPAVGFADDAESPWSKDKGKKDDDDEGGEDEGDDEEGGEDEADEEGDEEGDDEAEATTDGAEPVSSNDEAERDDPWGGTPALATTKPSKGGGALGLGFAVGTINGLSVKVWPHETHGIVLNLGVPNRLNAMAVALSYRVHPKAIRVPDSPVALHPNLGPVVRVRTIFHPAPAPVFAELAGGLAVGVSLTVDDVPAEIYFEVAPLFAGSISALGTEMGFSIDGIVGARFFF